ncbi:MAG: DNA polymerase II large subunit [Candidatus Bathyarchaeota archaeon]|nr:MAG: DNA polymerase II large subunit [Candidatus Bathyarchaeota archaeon]
MEAKMSEDHRRYVKSLENELQVIHEIANKAREKGLDPALIPESEIAESLAELVEGLVGPIGVAESIKELSRKLPREELAFKIAEEIVYGKFGHLETQPAAEQAVRTALAILTEGITAAPLQGVAKVLLKTNFDNTNYLAIYFAGPIRSAGGTDQALTLVIGDFIRRLLGLERYKSTEEEINRFIEEMRLYERGVNRFQYHVTDEQLRIAIESIPVEVTGTESDPVEVQSFRDLPRIETNRVRGGALRVVNDGVIGRAAKVSIIVEKLGIEGWEWLKHIGKADGTHETEKTAGFMEDVIAGRPIFSFPSQSGGFRLRYGRARNTGLAAVGIHPLTMLILNQFLAGGTQIRLELPGKGGVVLPVDSIEPPTVLLKDKAVVRVSRKNFSRIKSKIHKILYLGDLLVNFGDFLYNNRMLCPSGYTEEWWCEELKLAIMKDFGNTLEKAATAADVSVQRLKMLISQPFYTKPTVKEAVTIARNLNVPLHPYYNFFWSNMTIKELRTLRQWALKSQVQKENKQICNINGKLNITIKGLLERLGLPHEISRNRIIIEKDEAFALATSLGLDSPTTRIDDKSSLLEVLKNLSGITIRARAPTTIGARMGRPEKAKRREMKPRVHLLFPVGLAGGAQRDLIKATKKGAILVDFTKRRCPTCKRATFRIKCLDCNTETIIEKSCPRCGRQMEGDTCSVCKVATRGFERQRLNLKKMIDEAYHQLGISPSKVVKGVKGLSNEHKIAEIIEKGLLRANKDLSVYKDGTIRFDTTNAPLTHFKPGEVGISIEKLKQLGYMRDCQGNPLAKNDQICELRVQDLVIPKKSATYFIRVASFLDQLLEKVYKLPRFYKVEKIEDLVGHLIIGLAPHTSVGILGRIVGFTDLNVCYAHPLWHSAKRRDCDGDEDALMLALDTLLNFSRAYLPSQIGGIMDAPLFIIPVVNPVEVQRQAHELDIVSHYPLAFYEKTFEKTLPSKVTNLVNLVAHKLGSKEQFENFNYTTPVSNISMGNRVSMYRKLKSMTDKLNSQLELAEKIEAVDPKKLALKVLTTHFLRDISGNLRAFSTQSFRCKLCNRRFRRVPLKGKCSECGGQLSLTVYRGGIEKYLKAATHLVEKYGLPKYYLHRLNMVKQELIALFEGKKPRQISLADFA